MEEPQEEKSLKDAGSSLSARHSETESPLKQIRTFQGDVATALERQKESLVSIQRTEAAKRSGLETSSEPKVGRSIFFFVGGFILIALGALGGRFAYNEFLRKTAPPTIVVPESRFIPVETSEEIDASNVSRESLISEINRSLTGVPPAQIKHLVLNTTSAEFLLALEGHAPGSLVRALDPLFMFGSLGEDRFIIFKLISFENTFAGMLSWEKTLGEDLAPLFGSASLLKNIGPESVFKDVTSKNKDARVLYAPVETGSATTTPVLLYSFFSAQGGSASGGDTEMLIVTDSLETLQILIDRLTRELLSR